MSCADDRFTDETLAELDQLFSDSTDCPAPEPVRGTCNVAVRPWWAAALGTRGTLTIPAQPAR